jgi:hypothetical protein
VAVDTAYEAHFAEAVVGETPGHGVREPAAADGELVAGLLGGRDRQLDPAEVAVVGRRHGAPGVEVAGDRDRNGAAVAGEQEGPRGGEHREPTPAGNDVETPRDVGRRRRGQVDERTENLLVGEIPPCGRAELEAVGEDDGLRPRDVCCEQGDRQGATDDRGPVEGGDEDHAHHSRFFAVSLRVEAEQPPRCGVIPVVFLDPTTPDPAADLVLIGVQWSRTRGAT